MKLISFFLVKCLLCKKGKNFPKFFLEIFAFYGLDMEPEPEPERNSNLSKVRIGTVTCQKSEPEPELFKRRTVKK